MIRPTLALGLALSILLSGGRDRAAAQGDLIPEEPVSGTIEPGQAADFTFNGTAGEVISLLAAAQDAALDPVLTLLDSGGRPLLSSDDYAYPASRDALLEAVTLPRTGVYTARVEGFAASAGPFTLTLRRGFAGAGFTDGFASSRGWSAEDGASLRSASGTLIVSFTGQGYASAFNDDAPAFAEFYARVEVVDVRASEPGWIAGLTARARGGVQYTLLIRGDGTWRVVEHSSDGERVLRDWISHPAIVAGQTRFSIGMLLRNRGLHLFYNDTLLGLIPALDLTGEAQIGLVAGIQRALPQEAVITYDNLTITTPLRIEEAPVLPQVLIVGDSQTLIYALTRRHLVPATGQVALTVPESSVQFARSGVSRLLLGGGVEYRNFVIGATVDLTQNTVGLSGCGLVLRSQSDDDYALAFFDSQGGYGLSVQAQGEFQPGLFSQGLPPERTHHLLVIAAGTTLYFYIDGRAAGSLITPDVPGQVGGAVVNYDAVDTLCQFRNLWVYQWEP
jgi:hypothetical protein